MSRKRDRPNKPIETLRNTWESTADLEETIVAMFDVHPEATSLPRPNLDLGSRVSVGAPELVAPNVGAPNVDAPERGARVLPAAELVTPTDTAVYVNGGAPDLSAPELNIGAPIVRAPNPGAPTLPAPTVQAPDVGAPTHTAPELGAPEPDTSETQAAAAPRSALHSLRTETPAPTVSAPDLGAPEFDYVEVYRPAREHIHPAVTAQDGHTHGEQALYATLWRLAKTTSNGGKILSAGERTLAAEVPMAYSTVQENLRSLANKHAIEIRPGGPNRPKVYLVFSYDEILRRRRAAGLTHVMKRTSGVTLVNPNSSAPSFGALRIGAPHVGAPGLRTGAARSGAATLPAGAPSFGNSGAPSFDASIRYKEVEEGTSSSDIVMQAVTDVLGFVDDDAIRLLISGCREQAPDATDEEIAHFAKGTAQRIRNMRGISNPIGLLIRQLPKCFQGDAFRKFREATQRRREEELEKGRQDQLEMRQVLEDPATSEEDKAWLRQALGIEE